MSSVSTPQDPPPPTPADPEEATTTAATTTVAADTTTVAAPPEPTPSPVPSKSETTPPPSDSKKPPPPPPVPPPEPEIVTIPSYSRWFSWDGIHECEARHLPEFFDGKSPSKNPNLYKYFRNSIVKNFRANPSKKMTFTEARRTLVGDVGSIRRVFDFLDTWGLINYSPSYKLPFRWEDKESKSSSATPPPPASASTTATDPSNGGERSKKWCSGCKAVCTIACFVCDKYDLALCARCYVRGNYRVGVSSSEFRRVEISEPAKTEWTDKETLQLLEAIMHHGDDWKRVAEHVGGRTEKDCVARFIRLPFGEQFVEPGDHSEEDSMYYQTKDQTKAESGDVPFAKRRNVTPLADASNPIMAQAAFLSALAGVEVSEAAAQAAVATLYNMHHLARKGGAQSQAPTIEQEPVIATNGHLFSALEKVCAEEESFLRREEDEFVNSISTITEVQMKEILDKIIQFEQMDLQLDREWHQVHQMKHQLFLDQLTLLFHKAPVPKSVENVAEENVRT